jgi:hypothetical protein
VQEVKDRPTFDVNWFNDGGLTANLSVQFFGAPLPSRPTFAIDLAGFTNEYPRSPDERLNSYLPVVNPAGLHRRRRVETKASVTARFVSGSRWCRPLAV